MSLGSWANSFICAEANHLLYLLYLTLDLSPINIQPKSLFEGRRSSFSHDICSPVLGRKAKAPIPKGSLQKGHLDRDRRLCPPCSNSKSHRCEQVRTSTGGEFLRGAALVLCFTEGALPHPAGVVPP